MALPSRSSGSPIILAESDLARRNAERIVAFFDDVLATGDAGRASLFLGADFVDRDAENPDAAGRQSVVMKLRAMWSAFPSGRYHLEEVIAAGDRVSARSVFKGRQDGAFGALPPSGRSVTVSFADFYRLEAGLIVEHRHVFDQFGLMQQLGALPAE